MKGSRVTPRPFFYLGDLRGGGNRDKAGVRGLVGPQGFHVERGVQ